MASLGHFEANRYPNWNHLKYLCVPMCLLLKNESKAIWESSMCLFLKNESESEITWQSSTCLLLEIEIEIESESVRLTFVFLLWQPGLLHLLGCLHEEWEDGSEPQDVNKLMAVIGPLGSGHAVVQDLQGAGSRHLLLSAGGGRERKTRLG